MSPTLTVTLSERPRSHRRVGMLVLLWLLVASVFVAQNAVGAVTLHQRLQWLPVVWFELEYWLVFLLFSPFFFWMARRFPLEREHVWRSLLAHATAGVLFALVQPLVADAMNYATLLAVSPAHDPYRGQLLATMMRRYPLLGIIALWKYGVVIGVYYAFDYHRKYRTHEVRNAQLERQFAVAQLAALRMQLEPHFLFNALHSAALLAPSHPAKAHAVLVQLADLLREVLDSTPETEVTVAQELDFLDRYLAIERVRFDDRLSVSYEVPEELTSALIPSLILQPLVENAIHHAFAQHSATRALVIRAFVEGEQLQLEVEDDGPGLPAGWRFDDRARTGLTNVQARVSLANGSVRRLEFMPVMPTGLRVRISLPWRRTSRAAA